MHNVQKVLYKYGTIFHRQSTKYNCKDCRHARQTKLSENMESNILLRKLILSWKAFHARCKPAAKYFCSLFFLKTKYTYQKVVRIRNLWYW